MLTSGYRYGRPEDSIHEGWDRACVQVVVTASGRTLTVLSRRLPLRTSDACPRPPSLGSGMCGVRHVRRLAVPRDLEFDISAARLVAPITVVGLTALSVLISTKRSAPASADARAAGGLDFRRRCEHCHGHATLGGFKFRFRQALRDEFNWLCGVYSA